MNLHDKIQVALLMTDPVEYLGDCEKICSVARQEGVLITTGQAQRIWREYSERACAGWLSVSCYSDEDILSALHRFAAKVDGQ